MSDWFPPELLGMDTRPKPGYFHRFVRGPVSEKTEVFNVVIAVEDDTIVIGNTGDFPSINCLDWRLRKAPGGVHRFYLPWGFDQLLMPPKWTQGEVNEIMEMKNGMEP